MSLFLGAGSNVNPPQIPGSNSDLLGVYGVQIHKRQMFSQDVLSQLNLNQETKFEANTNKFSTSKNSIFDDVSNIVQDGGISTNRSNNYIVFDIQDPSQYYSKNTECIIAALPKSDKFTLSLSAEYDRPFSQALQKTASKTGAIYDAYGSTGNTLFNPFTDLPIWKGISPPKLVLDVVFIAQDDPEIEVHTPISLLYSLLTPRQDTSNSNNQFTAPIYNTQSQQIFDFLKKSVNQNVQQGQQNAANAFKAFTGTSFNFQSIASTLNSGASAIVSQYNNFTNQAFNQLIESSKQQVSLYLGNFLYFPHVIIESVSFEAANRVNIQSGLLGNDKIGYVYAEGQITVSAVLAPFITNGNLIKSQKIYNQEFNSFQIFY